MPKTLRPHKSTISYAGPWVNKLKKMAPILPLIERLPQKIQRLPYWSALLFLKLTSSEALFPRNSFVTQTMTLGLSDLDLTAVYDAQPSALVLENLRSFHQRMKVLFPFLGELNTYSSQCISVFIDYVNPYEQQRDPYLVTYSKKAPSRAHGMVFLARLFEADKHQLAITPEWREKKWQTHFQSVGLDKREENILSQFLTCFEGLVGDPEELRLYWDGRLKGAQGDGLLDLLFRPYEWEVMQMKTVHSLTEPQAQVLQESLHWELWGLLGQLHELYQRPEFVPHLQRLQNLAQAYHLDDTSRGLQALSTLARKLA